MLDVCGGVVQMLNVCDSDMCMVHQHAQRSKQIGLRKAHSLGHVVAN